MKDAAAPRRGAWLSWPAYAVLVATWQVLLGVKVAVVLVAGLAASLHGGARSRKWLGIWGGTAGLTSVAALVVGVFLAG